MKYRVAGGSNGKRYNGVNKDSNSYKLTKEDDIKHRWKEYFEDILNCDDPPLLIPSRPNPYTRYIDMRPISNEELNNLFVKLQNKISPGEDRLSADMLNALGQLGMHAHRKLLNNVCLVEQVPSDWKRGIIVRVPKKGDLSNCANWRGMTLLTVIRKILSHIIYNRIKDAIFGVLYEEQAGFRETSGYADQIFVLKNIVEQCEEWRES